MTPAKSMNLEVQTSDLLLKKWLQKPIEKWQENYLAHYSTYWNAISTDPRLLLIPVDDHIVHRGDGVFEAFRLIENNLYLLDEHLKRLQNSAHKIGIILPWSLNEIKILIERLAEVTKESHLIFRLFVSRGSGSFSTNPYDCPEPHLTLVACRFNPYASNKYQEGVTIGRAKILQKPEPFCTIKSCNYLPNVLMKKEAVDRGLDFVVSFNEKDFLAESATENIFILNKNNCLVHPRYQMILPGTTLQRCLHLAQTKLKLKIQEADISEKELCDANEVFIIGTTLDILPVNRYEDTMFPHKTMAQSLLQLLLEDQKSSSSLNHNDN